MFTLTKTLLTVALLCALTGCGADTEEPGIPTAGGAPPSATGSGPGDLAAFQACLEKRGVLVDPGTAPDPADPAFAAAAQACRAYLPDGGDLPRASAQDLEQARAFALCMRENGLPDYPDPPADGSLKNFTPPAAAEDDIVRATEACAKHIKAAQPGSGGSAG